MSNHTKKSYFARAVYFLLFIILMGLPDVISEFLPAETINNYDVPLAFFQSILNIAITYFVFSRYQKQLTSNNPNDYGWHRIEIKNIVLVLILLLFSLAIDKIFIDFIDISTPDNQELVEEIFNQTPIAAVISSVIFAPVLEELLFRGIFFNYFFNQAKLTHRIGAIILSGALFGFAHETTLSLAFLYYVISGWLLAITYSYTKDLRYSILLHMLMNAVATVTIFISF